MVIVNICCEKATLEERQRVVDFINFLASRYETEDKDEDMAEDLFELARLIEDVDGGN
jgi:hypothetical protein